MDDRPLVSMDKFIGLIKTAVKPARIKMEETKSGRTLKTSKGIPFLVINNITKKGGYLTFSKVDKTERVAKVKGYSLYEKGGGKQAIVKSFDFRDHQLVVKLIQTSFNRATKEK